MRKRKILCYDLHGADSNDYNEVYKYIENELFGTRATESVFVFYSENSNGDIRNDFTERFGKGVSILVNDFPLGAALNKIENRQKWFEKETPKNSN